MNILPLDIWRCKAKEHEALLKPFNDAFLERRKTGQKHAVHDFLYTYYNFSPAKLRQWVPSIQEGLIVTTEIRDEYPWLNDYWFCLEGDLLYLNKARIPKKLPGLAGFVAELCDTILKRPPRFKCYGLHEWAMVYKLSPEELRHNYHLLRLSPEDLARFVESQTICCSHYDAFRFFTPEARPLNVLNPILDTRLQMEQAGCVHVNMDLYKWSLKLWPWIGSDFLAKTFMLAMEGRELDMRASPYDLKAEGFEPICIETEEGRKQYQNEQRILTERSTPLREELRSFCVRLQNEI